MRFKLTKYKTIKGTKSVLELVRKKTTEAVIYKDNLPFFYVNCFDLQTESNVIMNSLVLCQKRKLEEVVKEIGKKNMVNLSIQKTPLIVFKKTTEYKEIELPPLPIAWLIGNSKILK